MARLTALLCCALIIGCAAGTPPPRDALEEEFAREVAVQAQRSASLIPMLEVTSTDQTIEGRVMRYRAKLRNPLPETVVGARLFMRLSPTAATADREIETLQKELGVTIPSGDSTMLQWDVESMYFEQSSRSGFRVEAYPKRVGDTDIPPPRGWKEGWRTP